MKLELGERPEITIPFLFEMWNWVGDTSILPTKWSELLKKHDSQCGLNSFALVTREILLNQYVKNPKFDPNAFFFLTTRSEAVGGLLIWPCSETVCEMITLIALPSHRDRSTVQALIALGVNYAISKGFNQVVYNGNDVYYLQALAGFGFTD